MAKAIKAHEEELDDIRKAFFAYWEPRYGSKSCQTEVTMKRYDRLENWQRRGEAAERNLEHNHRASHTDNLTVLRMRKTGYGCLSCQHCKDLSRRMAFREQFRWTGECLACLSPQRLAEIELPPQVDPLRELKNIRRRT